MKDILGQKKILHNNQIMNWNDGYQGRDVLTRGGAEEEAIGACRSFYS